MLERFRKVKIQVETVLKKLKDETRDKKRRAKIQGLFLTEDEEDKLIDVVDALRVVRKGSTLLCGNDVTLASADRVSI